MRPCVKAENVSSAALDLPNADKPRREPRRVVTVYDAVAGNVSSKGRFQNEATEGKRQAAGQARVIEHLTRHRPMAPNEFLFRRNNASERYAEHGINEPDLPHGGRGVLPESDLLKAIHAYTSHFYGALERRHHGLHGYGVDECTMDGTALLAFGILMEEAGRELLGRRGDVVFTEGADEHALADSGGDEAAAADGASAPVGYLEVGSGSKRRKVMKQVEDQGQD